MIFDNSQKSYHFRTLVHCKPNFLTNWIFYWQIRFCTYYEFSLKQMSDIRDVSKSWPSKDDFRSISPQK